MQEEILIRAAERGDREFWLSLDRELSEAAFEKKVDDGQGYVLLAGGRPLGILRYNLFWDCVPFCTLLYLADGERGKGYGTMLIGFWEREMKALGYKLLLTSTRADETAQHFYRANGYSDCGGLLVPDQPTEIFFGKRI